MKAAVCSHSGPPEVVQIRDVPKPVPKDDEVLVRVHASTICAADYRVRGAPYLLGWLIGVRNDKILGMELSGTVSEVGRNVTKFQSGDQVFGGTGFKLGAHAEYACCREYALEKKPANISLEESAACMFGGITALTFLRMANIQPGQNVLVYGASGSVGVFVVQLAKHFGATVTAVCSTTNVEKVRSLGADRVIDYTKDDFASDGPTYDLLFDAVGKAGAKRSLRALKKGGTLVNIALSGGFSSIPKDIVIGLWISLFGGVKTVGGIGKPVRSDITLLKELIEAGKVRTVIDRRYSLDNIVEAHRYAEAGHKRGHVIIQI